MNSVSLDDLNIRALANANPKLFLETYKWPIIIDEIQKATPLLSAIKEIIDEIKYACLTENKQVPLMYVLTGSNQFELQEAISESLAGRTAILNMSSLSNVEIERQIGDIFNPHLDTLFSKYQIKFHCHKYSLQEKNQEIF